jgi:C4-dicarboxylate-specific signal transduction histidine kinase
MNLNSYADRIKKIIDHVRIFSREQYNTIFVPININEGINNALVLLKNQIIKHDIAIETDLAQDIPLIKGNIYKIEQVLINLISNSKDAIIEKDEKKLFQPDEKKLIFIKTLFKNNKIIIEVSNNGVEIPKANLGKLFIPFFTTKDFNKGTGLGLSVVYGIIKEMKGEIEVESEKSKFTIFRIIFDS